MKFKEIQPQKRKFNLELNEDELKLLLWCADDFATPNAVTPLAPVTPVTGAVDRFYNQLVQNFTIIFDYDPNNCFNNDFPED